MSSIEIIRPPGRSQVFYEQLIISQSAGKLRIFDMGGFQSRNDAVIDLIRSAHDSGACDDFRPVTVNTGDLPKGKGKRRILSFSGGDGFCDIPVPDFLFGGWPETGVRSFDETAACLASAGSHPARTDLLGWLGNCDTHPTRWRLHAIGERHKDAMEIRHVSWRGRPVNGAGMSLEDQVREFSLLLDVEGRGYSARLKLLLHSGRPVLVQEQQWTEYWFRNLEPMVHYIPVAADLSDLPDKVRWAREHTTTAEAIGVRGREFAQQQLTRDRAVTRWHSTLLQLASIKRGAYAPARHRLLGRCRYSLPLR